MSVDPATEPTVPAAPIRVLHLIESLGRGGAEQALLNNLRAMDRRRFRNAVCHLYPAADLAPEIRALNVPVWSLRLGGPRDLIRGALPLGRYLRAYQPHILHTQLFASNLLGRIVGRLARVPVIMTTVQYTDHEPSDRTTYSRKRHLLDALSIRLGVDQVIAVSDAVRRSTRKRLGVRQVICIPNAIELGRFANGTATDRARLRVELGAAPGEILLLAVGRLHPQKGHRYAILALRTLADAGVPVRLVIVGQGPLAAKLQALAEAEGVGERLQLLGVRDDVPRLLQACDVFVFPSLGEGLPVALIEAMAAGRACVASDIPAISEVVENGRTGLLAGPGDVRGLAAALISLWRDQNRAPALGAAARAHVISHYDVETIVRRLERLYESSLARRALPPGTEN